MHTALQRGPAERSVATKDDSFQKGELSAQSGERTLIYIRPIERENRTDPEDLQKEREAASSPGIMFANSLMPRRQGLLRQPQWRVM